MENLNFENLDRRYLEVGRKEDVCFEEKLYMVAHIKDTGIYSELINENKKDDVEKIFEIAWNYWLKLETCEYTMFDYIYTLYGEEDKTRARKILELYESGGLEKAYDFIDTLF